MLSAYYRNRSRDRSEERYRGEQMSVVDLADPAPGQSWNARRSTSVSRYGRQAEIPPAPPAQPPHEEELSWTLTILLLMTLTVVRLHRYLPDGLYLTWPCGQLVAINADWMVDTMDHVSPSISKEWIGLILLPTVGCLAGTILAALCQMRRAHDFRMRRMLHCHECVGQGSAYTQRQRRYRVHYRE